MEVKELATQMLNIEHSRQKAKRLQSAEAELSLAC